MTRWTEVRVRCRWFYLRAPGPVTVDSISGTATGDGSDSLTGIENIEGSLHDDTLIGDAGPNLIWANAGDDAISGGDGDDVLDAGAGTDSADGGTGRTPVATRKRS